MHVDKVYEHKNVEEKIYKDWEEKGYFAPEVNPGGIPYCIILPPPNANAPLHFGHAMYVVEDILIRYHRMQGDAALWLPGADHAGFETQFVFEKHLQKDGKSRFDYDRETLYKMIWDFVQSNRGGMEGQLRKLGFSLDWSRKKFTLDPDIVAIVYKTFKKLYDDGLIYRANRLVNYCTFDGTSFSDLEVVHQERKSPLYYIKYGPLVLATTRPETKFGDTAVAVNPKDSRYKEYVGKDLDIETVLGSAKIKVVADEMVDMEFGTGVVKITPAHDFNDFEVAERHNLSLKQVIGFDGKMNEYAGKFAGLYIKQARAAVVEEMQKKGLIEKIDESYVNRIGLCYKCKNVLEPLPLEQWFVKVKPLAENAIKVVKNKKIKITPKNFETIYFQWLENLRDWNISRQTVWGIRIPAFKCEKCTKWIVTDGKVPEKCANCNSNKLIQDTDTFDTWFSSGQWPFAALRASRVSTDLKTFYPTSVMETGRDILFFWVARMVMLGFYITDEAPFKEVLFHGLVNDPYGRKMSKSKGNVVNPLELVDQYGADAVRFALIYGNATGNDQALSYTKLDGARKFANKLWNMARFIEMKRVQSSKLKVKSYEFEELLKEAKNETDKEWVKKTQGLVSEVSKYIDNYQFNLAAERLYEFIWHEFADKYIEDVKNRIDENSYLILAALYLILLKLLHPFMPFITEEINKQLGFSQDLIISAWPHD
ncbi:MAG: valine--tRNA ligase [Candidatus Levybacteria bacterium CG_4_10_14_0_2_um_filter_36_16]|nr:MAG: valine--tRNA ligase [Candidatus Levybacteria bacterium CG_4_10_14_0_2_um_filter_36_16]